MTGPPPRPLRLLILLGLPIVFCAAALALPLSATAGELPAEEASRIEAMIATVAQMTDAAFLRNGTAFDAAVAAEFLRRKWQAQAARVGSAEDFIAVVASFSATTGRPYLIRFSDGGELPCSVFLRDELAKLRMKRSLE
jgi:hypothetical protein